MRKVFNTLVVTIYYWSKAHWHLRFLNRKKPLFAKHHLPLSFHFFFSVKLYLKAYYYSVVVNMANKGDRHIESQF